MFSEYNKLNPKSIMEGNLGNPQIQKLRLGKKGRNEIKVDGTQKRNRIKW